MQFIYILLLLLTFDVIFMYFSKNLFIDQIVKVQKKEFQLNVFSGALCYLVLAFILYNQIILKNGSMVDAFILGGSVYAVFELTNHSLFQDWEYQTVIVDSLWGGVLFALTTYAINSFK